MAVEHDAAMCALEFIVPVVPAVAVLTGWPARALVVAGATGVAPAAEPADAVVDELDGLVIST